MVWEDYEQKVDWDRAVYLYLTSPFGMDLYFWDDGSVSIYEDGFVWDEKKTCVEG